jgi:hypothetical protein
MSADLTKRRNKISGQFASRLIEMLESPAYRALSQAAHRALSRIEIEFAHHGGTENGKLPSRSKISVSTEWRAGPSGPRWPKRKRSDSSRSRSTAR